MNAFKDSVDQRGALFAVVVLQNPLRTEDEEALFRNMADEFGFPYHYVTPDLFQHLEAIPGEGHLTAESNDLVALTIAPWVGKTLLTLE